MQRMRLAACPRACDTLSNPGAFRLKFISTTLAATFFLLGAAAAFAHGDVDHGKAAIAKPVPIEEHDFGRQGDPAKADRRITIRMSDAMRFSPAEIKVRQGETIRFVVKNGGKIRHEMVIGTLAELREHGELMKRYPNMEHDEPYMAHVAPGKSREITWTFTKAGDFHFGCLVAGHFDAGMVGRIEVASLPAAGPVPAQRQHQSPAPASRAAEPGATDGVLTVSAIERVN
jgi:uncharacterized cupredoxin-like copper-binding protein